jgi:hypothetical protein
MTRSREIRLEHLIGRRVVDADGRALGRLEEAHAEHREGELVVVEWVLGAGGLLERLGVLATVRALFGWPSARTPQVLDWSELDLSNPERPRRRPTAAPQHGSSRSAAHR